MNKIFLSGNLTREPELKQTATGKSWLRVGIAVNRPFSKDKAVDFFNLLAWDKTAEFLGKYFSKGSRVLVEGRLQTSAYENKDGVKVNSVEVVVENAEFAEPKSASKKSNKDSATQDKADWDGEPIDPNDTPF